MWYRNRRESIGLTDWAQGKGKWLSAENWKWYCIRAEPTPSIGSEGCCGLHLPTYLPSASEVGWSHPSFACGETWITLVGELRARLKLTSRATDGREKSKTDIVLTSCRTEEEEGGRGSNRLNRWCGLARVKDHGSNRT